MRSPAASRTSSPASASSSRPVASCSTHRARDRCERRGRRGRLTTRRREPSTNVHGAIHEHEAGCGPHRVAGREPSRSSTARSAGSRCCARCRSSSPASSTVSCTATASVCGTDNPIAFAKLRDLLMMHFAIRKKSAAELGEPQIAAIEALRHRAAAKSLPSCGLARQREPTRIVQATAIPDHHRDVGRARARSSAARRRSRPPGSRRGRQQARADPHRDAQARDAVRRVHRRMRKLLVDAFTHTLDKPETLLPGYALINRIRLCASPAGARRGRAAAEAHHRPVLLEEPDARGLRQLVRSDDADPLKAFGEACRAELRSMRARRLIDPCQPTPRSDRTPTEAPRFADDFASRAA